MSPDRAQAQASAESFINLLGDDEAKDVSVSVNGSMSITDDVITSTGANVSAALIEKVPA